MGVLKRPVVRETRGVQDLSAVSGLAKSYPAVWEFLTLDRWDDGVARITGTIGLSYEEGLCKIRATDRDGTGRVLWLSGETLEDVLASLDDVLATGEGEWRPDRFKATAGRRGR